MIEESEIATDEFETEDGLEEVTEPSKPESPEETARAVWEELAAEAEEKAAQEGEKPAEEPEEKPNEISEAARKLAQAKRKKRQTFVPVEDAQQGQPAEAPAAQPTEKIEPPASWTAQDKERFHALDPVAQKNAVKWFKDAQAHSTRLWQEMSTEKAKAKEIVEVADEYFGKKIKLPDGMTKGQAIRQLLDYQQHINEDSIGAIADMIRYRKVSLADIQARLNGQTQAPPRQESPQQRLLTPEEVNRIVEERLQAHSQTQAQSQAAESATESVRQVQREMQNGKYLYPELHEAAYIQRIQPLVSYYRGNNPEISWGDVYKLAVQHDRQARGVSSPGTANPASPRLTSENIQTVRQASSSLRSRGGNGAIPRMSEPKPNETARESAEAAYWETIGRKQH